MNLNKNFFYSFVKSSLSMKEDLIIMQLNTLTKWVDDVNKKAKSITELSDIVKRDGISLYVAVSDGQNTGKILFPLNTITDNEIERLLKLSLETDSNYTSIVLKNGDGVVLSTLDMTGILDKNNERVDETLFEFEEKLNDLDFDPATAKPYERYIEHSN